MPRLPRFNLIDVPQHVIQRGNNRQACFFDFDDYTFCLECLAKAAGDTGCDIHAYVLMTNHVHILATPRRNHAVPKMMQAIGRRYVQYVYSAISALARCGRAAIVLRSSKPSAIC